MSFTNYETKELNCKILYFGPEGSGKTTNLRSIYQQSSPGDPSAWHSAPIQSTEYFEFLPISLGQIDAFHVKLHLYTMANQSLFESSVPMILHGLDGFVFVCDSKISRLKECIEEQQRIQNLLQQESKSWHEIPHVIQYNKRDLADIAPVDLLCDEVNIYRAPEQEAIASAGVGTLETLKTLTKMILTELAKNKKSL